MKSPKTTFSFLELQCAFFVDMSLLFVGIVDKRISEFSFRAFFHFRALQSRQPQCCIALHDPLVFFAFL